MGSSPQLSMERDLFAPYSARVDRAIRAAFGEKSELPMYGMLRYFMGYADESLVPVQVVAGKRIRANLVLLVADLFGGGASAEDLAVAVELFHNFTLIHDDIEDNDELRRGRPTVWKVWGVDHAINAGDAQAFMTSDFLLRAAATDECGARAAQELNTHFLQVAEGQYLDFELTKKPLEDPTVTREAYLEMIRKKTSVLVGTAVAAGGLAAGVDASTRDRLFRYGESLGMAYQIADDMASIWGSEQSTGKRVCGDVVERKKTYPVLYARDQGAVRLQTLYAATEELREVEVREVVALLEETGAHTATRSLGETYRTQAKDVAQTLPLADSAREALVGLVDRLVRFAPDPHHAD